MPPVLVAPFGFAQPTSLRAADVAHAIGAGLEAAGWEVDLCPLEPDGDTRPLLDALRFRERMLACRALVLGQGTLAREDLRTTFGELATDARQNGVPAHAIVGTNRLDLFDQRILDLQNVLEAGTLRQIKAAAASLAARL